MQTAADNPFTAILSDGETILWMGQPDEECYREGKSQSWKQTAFWLIVVDGAVSFFPYGLWPGLKPTDWQFVLWSQALITFVVWMLYCDSKSATAPLEHYCITSKRVIVHAPHADDLFRPLTFEFIGQIELRFARDHAADTVFAPKFLAPNTGVQFRCVARPAEVQGLAVSLLTGAGEGTRK